MIRYSIKSLLSKKTISILFSLAILITISISMLAINITSQVEEGFYNVDKKYDVIIGPSGSDTQLVMSSMFFSDDPLGTLDEKYLEEINENYNVEKIIPLAIADYYKDSRIVGTTSELIEEYKIKEGNIFSNDFEIVIGSNVAEKYNLSVGDTIITSHGTTSLAEEHEHSPYIVVGILEKTNSAYDNTCFTTVESVHAIHTDNEENLLEDIVLYDDSATEEEHDHSEEIHNHSEEEEHEHEEHQSGYTALLIRTGNMAIASQLETDLSDDLEIQVVNTTKVLRKLLGNFDMSKEIALLLCSIIVILAVILTCVMSFLMLINLKKDIDLFGFLGMKKSKVYNYVLWQVGVLVSISVTLSLAINRIVLKIANTFSSKLGIVLDIAKIYPNEIYISLIYILIIIISTIVFVYFKVNKENK